MAMALEAASEVAALTATTVTNEEDDPMVTILPQEVIDALAELDLELSEGRKTPFFMYGAFIDEVDLDLDWRDTFFTQDLDKFLHISWIWNDNNSVWVIIITLYTYGPVSRSAFMWFFFFDLHNRTEFDRVFSPVFLWWESCNLVHLKFLLGQVFVFTKKQKRNICLSERTRNFGSLANE